MQAKARQVVQRMMNGIYIFLFFYLFCYGAVFIVLASLFYYQGGQLRAAPNAYMMLNHAWRTEGGKEDEMET
jgi:hypothetical protein